MISVTSGEENPFVTGGATPPPLPSRKTEVLPDPQALIRDRRTAANAVNPDTPALPPKVSLKHFHFFRFNLNDFNLYFFALRACQKSE